MPRALWMVIAVGLLLAPACGDKESPGASGVPGAGQPAPTRIEGTDTPQGLSEPFRLSAIYAVPIAPEAVAEPALSVPGREAYRVPDQAPYDVMQFYSGVIPDGKPFGSLAWCAQRTLATEPRVHESSWVAPGAQNFLVIQVSYDAQGTLLTILDDKANTSRTCD